MVKSKYGIVCVSFCILLLACGAMNWWMGQNSYGITAVSFVYVVLVIQWSVQVYRRVVNARLRRLFEWMGVNMIVLLAIRPMEYVFFWEQPFIARHIWYCMYIPLTFLPMLLFMIAAHVDSPEGDRKNHLQWLSVPAIIQCIGFVTNDLHGWAFSFERQWIDVRERFGRSTLYFISIIWMYSLLFGAFVMILRKCQSSSVRKLFWIPLLPVVLIGSYLVAYYYHVIPRINGIIPYDVPESITMMIIGVCEGFIYIGVIPSNKDYDRLFEQSGMLTEIVNEDGEIIYTSQFRKLLSTEQIRSAVNYFLMLDANTCLHSLPISGGFVCWADDLTVVNAQIDEMNELREKLKDEHTILEAENALKERKIRAEERDRLYQTVTQSVQPQLNKIQEMLEQTDAKDAHLKSVVSRAGIYQAYIKRRCNLALLAAEKEYMYPFEIMNSLWESLDFLKMNGIMCSMESSGNREMISPQVIMIYDLFEEVVEQTLPGLVGVFLHLQITEAEVKFKMVVEGEIPFRTFTKVDEVRKQGGQFTVTNEEEAQYIQLLFAQT